MIGFLDTDFIMLESAGDTVACFVLFSDTPLESEANVIVTSIDGTATSVGGEYPLICFNSVNTSRAMS